MGSGHEGNSHAGHCQLSECYHRYRRYRDRIPGPRLDAAVISEICGSKFKTGLAPELLGFRTYFYDPFYDKGIKDNFHGANFSTSFAFADERI
jgi:hypothetical protein